MRTTVILNDKLAAEAKRLAAVRNTTLSEIINEALRERLARPPAARSAAAFRMPVFRGQGEAIDSSPATLSEIGAEQTLRPYRG